MIGCTFHHSSVEVTLNSLITDINLFIKNYHTNGLFLPGNALGIGPPLPLLISEENGA